MSTMPNALERTGLGLRVMPWSFWLAHVSSPVAQLDVRRRPQVGGENLTLSWRRDFFDRGPRGIRGYFPCILRGSRLSFQVP